MKHAKFLIQESFIKKNDVVIGVCTINADPVVATFTEFPPTKLSTVLNDDVFGIFAILKL